MLNTSFPAVTWAILTDCALVVCAARVGKAQPYYVSPAGDDTNAVTREKPFATLQRAQQAARQKTGSVFLRGGTYYLPATLGFTAQDSGTRDAPEIFQNYTGEQPVICCGKFRHCPPPFED